jgi:hypothetical protein
MEFKEKTPHNYEVKYYKIKSICLYVLIVEVDIVI